MSILRKITRPFFPDQSREARKAVKGIFQNLSEIKGIAKRPYGSTQNSMKNDIDRDEFIGRYRRARITALISISFAAYSMVRMALSDSIPEVILSLVVFMLGVVLYMDLVRRLYAARKLWMGWDDRKKGVFVSWADYANATSESAVNLLPIRLEK